MALRTVSNTGGNWNATTTWVGGVVPLGGDTVDFTATSGNLVVNVNTALLSGIDFTNYLGTITFTNNINTNGIVNLGTGGYTQVGTSGLTINGATTISGTTTWSKALNFAGTTYTITLGSTINITGQVTFTQTGTLSFSVGANTFNPTGNILVALGTTTLPNNLNIVNLSIIPSTTTQPRLNDNTINISGNLTLNSSLSGMYLDGTTNLVLSGSGSQTWSHLGTIIQLRNNLTISTSGTLTVSGNVYYNTGTLTYIAGTVVSTGSVLNITSSTTINTSGMTWRDVAVSTGTVTLTSDLNSEVFRMNGSGNAIVNNSGGNVYILESLIQAGAGILQGTASINLIGTGTWIHTSVGVIRNNVNINTSGILTIAANIYYNTGTLTYIAGTVDTTTNNSTLNIGASTTLNTNGITWNNISITFGNITFSSNLNVLNFTVSGNSNPNLNLNKINVIGNLQIDGTNTVSGTSEIILLGDGTWSSILGSNAELRNNLTINAAGTIKLGTNVYYGVGTIKYLSGKINAKNSTLNIIGNTTLINCHKINFNNVRLNVSSIITMNEFFSGSPSLVTNIISSTSTSNYTIAFQDGFEKIAKFVNISNCTLSKPLQLLVITKSKRSSTNIGIRYINQSPNGIAKGEPSVNQTTFGANGLLPDPIKL